MTRAPWERRDDESATAFAWFVRYRSLSPTERSLSRLVSDDAGREKGGRRTGAGLRRRLEAWSSRHEWTLRVEAWDGLVDERTRAALLASAVRAAERQVAQLSVHLRGLALPALVLAERLQAGESEEKVKAELAELSVPQLVQLVASCSRGVVALQEAERAAHGWHQDAATVAARETAQHARDALRPPHAAWMRDPAAYHWTRDENLPAVWAAMEASGIGEMPDALRVLGEEPRDE